VCGLFGFAPGRGRCVSASPGASEYSALVLEHCISRSVRDSALLLSLTEARTEGLAPVGYVREPTKRRLRIGTWTRTLSGAEPAPAVRRACDEAAALCAALGHDVEPIAPPAIDGQALGDAYFLMAGAAVAGALQWMGQLRGTPVQRHELEPFSWALVEELQRQGPDALGAVRATFSASAERYLALVSRYDVVLTPTLATPPWRLGHLSPILPREELIRRTREAVGYTPIHNIAGCPAMSVPLHWTEEGLPIGSHFAAAPGSEALLLGLAYQLEEARPWHNRWAPFSSPRLFDA
jgi:amidase